jgi:hypothetical protein
VTVQSTVDKVLTGTVPSGTANGVLFLNGSKVVTSGSALTFDGTNLGVGTIFPIAGSGLTIGNDGNSNATVKLAFSTATTERASIELNGGSGELRLTAGYAGYGGLQTFFANGTEQMRLTSTGLGIGTSSPSLKLDVNGSAKFAGSYVSFNDNGYIRTDAANILRFQPGSGGYEFRNAGNNVNLAVLDDSGNLGLGVTPSAWSGLKALEIAGVGSSLASASNNNLYLSANAWYDGANWKYGTSAEATQYQSFTGSHKWFTAPSGTAGNAISFTQAMTLDASGNLLVGTTSSAGGKLEVVAPGLVALLGSNTTQNAFTGWKYNATTLGYVGNGAGVVTSGGSTDFAIGSTGSRALLFGTNDTERARIPAAGGMVVGTAALATAATDGFLYVPTCAGTPTGTPTTQTGTAPIVIDTTNHKLYFYSGGTWRDAGP